MPQAACRCVTFYASWRAFNEAFHSGSEYKSASFRKNQATSDLTDIDVRLPTKIAQGRDIYVAMNISNKCMSRSTNSYLKVCMSVHPKFEIEKAFMSTARTVTSIQPFLSTHCWLLVARSPSNGLLDSFFLRRNSECILFQTMQGLHQIHRFLFFVLLSFLCISSPANWRHVIRFDPS